MEKSLKLLESSLIPGTLGKSLGEEEDREYNEVINSISSTREVYHTEIKSFGDSIPELNYRRISPEGMPLFDADQIPPPSFNALCYGEPEFVDRSEENGFSSYHSFKKIFLDPIDWCACCGNIMHKVDGFECEYCGMRVHLGCLESVLGDTCYKNSVFSGDEIPPLPPSPQLDNEEDPPVQSTLSGINNGNGADDEPQINETVTLTSSEAMCEMSCIKTDKPIRYVVTQLFKRREEIIKTEDVYVKNLSRIVRFIDECEANGFYSKGELNEMFPNIREIFLAHFKYLRKMYTGENLFKYFIEKLSQKMKVYYPSYCKVTNATTDAVMKRCNEDPKFKQYVERFYERYECHIIGNYFSHVFQRVMRYPMLFDELNKYASDDDNNKSDMYAGCREAWSCAKDTVQEVNRLCQVDK